MIPPEPLPLIQWRANDIRRASAKLWAAIWLNIGVAVCAWNWTGDTPGGGRYRLVSIVAFAAVAAGNVASCFARRTHRLTEAGLSIATWRGTDELAWSEVRRATVGRGGVSLRTDVWYNRPVLVLPDDPSIRARVLDAVRSHLPEGTVVERPR